MDVNETTSYLERMRISFTKLKAELEKAINETNSKMLLKKKVQESLSNVEKELYPEGLIQKLKLK